MKWISVKDSLPKITEYGWTSIDVLFSDGKNVYYGYFLNHYNRPKHRLIWCHGEKFLQDITHWMPLPEPPKEELC